MQTAEPFDGCIEQRQRFMCRKRWLGFFVGFRILSCSFQSFIKCVEAHVRVDFAVQRGKPGFMKTHKRGKNLQQPRSDEILIGRISER